MESEGFVRKYGAAWHPTNKSGEFAIRFAEFPQPGVDQDYVYHVDRAKFDLLMLKHARSLGSHVMQGVTVKEVLFEDGHAAGVRCDVAGEMVVVEPAVALFVRG